MPSSGSWRRRTGSAALPLGIPRAGTLGRTGCIRRCVPGPSVVGSTRGATTIVRHPLSGPGPTRRLCREQDLPERGARARCVVARCPTMGGRRCGVAATGTREHLLGRGETGPPSGAGPQRSGLKLATHHGGSPAGVQVWRTWRSRRGAAPAESGLNSALGSTRARVPGGSPH